MDPGSFFVKEKKKCFINIYVFFKEMEELIISTSNLLHLTTLILALTPSGLVVDKTNATHKTYKTYC